jgi:hypothetical protein
LVSRLPLIGRRREDTPLSTLPDDIRAGDYWKVVDGEGNPLKSTEPGNLTGGVWMVVAPIGDGSGYAIGRLTKHTVRENSDGTISVKPGDGSSNSILMTGAHGLQFHGYIEQGVWVP